MGSTSQHLSRGLFIVIEGIDGSGKTTIAMMLIEKMQNMGFNTLYTFEPTDSDIVFLIRMKYKDFRDPYIDALTFALDRLLHVKLSIKPHIEKGYIVISDRYYYSSIAYQSASGAPMEWVMEINKYAPRPDLAIYLDIEPELALKRKSGVISRFAEFEELEFLHKVRRVYLEMVKQGLLIQIDASRSINDVYRDVEKLVFELIKSKATS